MLIGQFTYTACQAPGPYSATPGWKVKQAQAQQPGTEMPAAAVQAAVRPFGVFAAPAVPALATQAEIEQLPRCLRLDLVEGGFSSIAHLAAAGRDHSGRDAFFAHGLLVSVGGEGAPLEVGEPRVAEWGIVRPADLWGAQGWLTPYRAEAIEAAVVGVPPLPSDASPLNPERREDFVDLHPGQREFVLAAAQRTLTAGTPLVIVGMPVEAAMWTSQITHLLLPTAGWTVTFSTYEGGAHPDILRTGSPKIVGIPAEAGVAWQQVAGDQAVVHDPATSRSRENGGYRLLDGSLLPVEGWARLAETVCLVGWEEQVRTSIDRLGSRVGRALDQWPLIGLPAAVLSLPASTLQTQPAAAELAAQVAMEHFPSEFRSAPEVLGELVDAIFERSPDALGASGRMLAALDRGADPTGVVVDRLLDGYLRRLLQPGGIPGLTVPWLPERLRLTPAVNDQLLRDLDGLVGWVEAIEDPMVRVRHVLFVAELAERMGWLEGAPRATVERVVSDRARIWVVAALLGDGTSRDGVTWPRIPSWLWNDVLVDALQYDLAGKETGSVLADPDLRRIVDAAAGPLPTVYVQGETLAAMTAVDGERAAVLLMTATAPPPQVGQDNEPVEILQAAAFLRSVVSARGDLLVPADRLTDALRRWFPQVPPRAIVLADLIEQLRLSVPMADLCVFAAAAMTSLPPDQQTAAIVAGLRVAGARDAMLLGTPLEWHFQYAHGQPLTSREVGMATMPLTRPDIAETRLLTAFIERRMRSPLADAVRLRLARWVLVLAAQGLDLPGNAEVREHFGWLRAASREPLASELKLLYPGVARGLVDDLNRARTRPPVAADVLAAEWVVRARMAEMGVDGDPASLFFHDRAGTERTEWSEGVRALVRPEGRTREELAAFVKRVRLAAEDAGRVAQLPWAPENRRQALVDAAVDSATRLTSTSGPIGRIWRSPVRRDG